MSHGTRFQRSGIDRVNASIIEITILNSFQTCGGSLGTAKREGERETQREKEGQTDGQRKRDTQTEREGDTEVKRERDREVERESERQTE